LKGRESAGFDLADFGSNLKKNNPNQHRKLFSISGRANTMRFVAFHSVRGKIMHMRLLPLSFTLRLVARARVSLDAEEPASAVARASCVAFTFIA
jgi:hypothetical protein